jgi:hypothetical protein
MVKKYVCTPRSFLVINVCNQGKTFMLTLYNWLCRFTELHAKQRM